MLVGDINEGEENANREDPSRDVEGDELGWLNGGSPSTEDEQVNGGECIDGVDGYREKDGEP